MTASDISAVIERYHARAHAPCADLRAVVRDLRSALGVLELEPVAGERCCEICGRPEHLATGPLELVVDARTGRLVCFLESSQAESRVLCTDGKMHPLRAIAKARDDDPPRDLDIPVRRYPSP